MAPLNKMNY